MEPEADDQADCLVSRLSAVVADPSRVARERSEEPVAGAAEPVSARGRGGAGFESGGQRPAKCAHWRAERPSAIASGRGGSGLCRQREVAGVNGCREVSPGDVYLLSANSAVPDADRL